MKFIIAHYYILIILSLIVAGAAYFIYQRSTDSKTGSVPPSISPSPSPNIPKAEKYQVPILMYHYIRNAENESQLGKNLSVSPKNFAHHLQWLKDNNYQTLQVADLADPDKKIISKIIYAQKKPIVLTFDDGYLDAYTEGLPILEKNQMTATFYIIRDYVGRPEYMNESQIDELAKKGYEIGSHSLSHPDLTKLTPAEAKRQIAESKEETTTFCYPSGKYDATSVSLLNDAGYKAAVTTHFGIADENSELLELPRVRVEDSSGDALGRKIEAAHK